MRTNKSKRYEQQQIKELEKSTSNFSQHLMSNSKWVKLIDSLVQNITLLSTIQFKKIQSSEIGELLLTEDIEYGFDYWQNGFEGCNTLGGWLLFKEIEYLIFQSDEKSESNTQNLSQIQDIINNVGNFSIEIYDDHLKLNCYLK